MKQSEKMLLYEMRKKSPTLGVVISFFITGAGSMYAGKVAKGFALLFVQLALWLILMGWVMWIIAPILAYEDVNNYNSALKLELGI